MIQTVIQGAELEVVQTPDGGKAIIATDPSGHQFVLPLTESGAKSIGSKLAVTLHVATDLPKAG